MTAPAIVKKPNAGTLYVCLESYAAPEGTFKEGDRLRGDHPQLKVRPEYWIEDGTPTNEIDAAREARFPRRY